MEIIICPSCGAKNRLDERADRLQAICGRCGTALKALHAGQTTGKPLEVTDATFAAQVLARTDGPVLVDCWAAWCGPCRSIAPSIEQLAAESKGRWTIAKLDVDQNPQTAQQFQISSIPTLLIFKNGKMVDRIVGLQSKPALEKRLAAQI
ncbi:MAG TPA: thioredoxin [Tepidisphaeraceae bacterium]|nr:thioredoxin [Tepidisphaeraceae bacterium]